MPAAGAGRRFGGPMPKQYLPLAGRPIIHHTLERLLDSDTLGLVVALAADDAHWSASNPPADSRLLTTVGGAGIGNGHGKHCTSRVIGGGEQGLQVGSGNTGSHRIVHQHQVVGASQIGQFP